MSAEQGFRMIRGAIDEVAGNKIGGWIYSQEINLTGRQILAFLDGRCVGAGLVDVYRADLAAAGLGEGLCGFSFFVTVPSPTDVGRLQIRLDGSDLTLVPPGASLVNEGSAPAGAPGAELDPARLAWMRERGWLSQAEFDFLRDIERLGIHDWRMPRGDDGAPDPRVAARDLFALVAQRPIGVEAVPLGDEGALLDLVAAARQDQPWVALHAPRRARVRVHEGSHRAGGSATEPVAHVVGPERLLVLHAGVRFEADQALFRDGATGFRFRLAPA
jgi:hypothetical protein